MQQCGCSRPALATGTVPELGSRIKLVFGAESSNLLNVNVLTPVGMLYGLAMAVRNRLYDRGTLRSYSLGAPTISIGNLTTGGTGKTPLVALTSSILAESGEKVCVLTRGYGRAKTSERILVSEGESVLADAVTAGDEPVELARKLLGKAIVVADANRLASAEWAREKFGITVFVLDDGFQHRRVKRDLDIVCIDATNPCGNGRILPAGKLRESFKELRRADAIVITRTNLTGSIDGLVSRLRKRNRKAKLFRARTAIASVISLDNFLAGRTSEDGGVDLGSFFGFCAVGNPESFRKQLETEGFSLSGLSVFADHHKYTQHDADAIGASARSTGASALITTAKDAVKLGSLAFDTPVYVAIAETAIDEQNEFTALVLETGRGN